MGVTVKQLLELCKEQVNKGNGNKLILLSNDDEGNGYHKMFYHFTEGVSQDNPGLGKYDYPKNFIILG